MCTRILFSMYLWIIIYVQCNNNQSDILFDIYNTTGGEEWIIKWNISTIYHNPCSLFGVLCNNNNTINGLNLTSNNLIGTLPVSISNLTSLLSINMRDNKLFGSIPNEISNMPTIQTIDLSSNKLSGSIPPSIFLNTNLEILCLQNNKFSGSISSHFSLSHLKYAYFDNNILKSNIPHLPHTIYGATFHSNDFTFNTDLTGNHLSDFVFDLNSKPHLYALTLHNNDNLQGELSIFNTSTLKIFTAHSCQITHTLSSSIYFKPTHISLINNRLSSAIPSDYVTPYHSTDEALKITLFAQGNKFDFDMFKHNVPVWLSNSILNTNSAQLFYTKQLKILEYVIIILVLIMVIFLIFYHIRRLKKEKIKKADPAKYMEAKQNDPLYNFIHMQPFSFFSQLKDIAKYLYFIPTLLFACLTSILYFTYNENESGYYTNADFLLKWSITYIASSTATTTTLASQWIASVYTTIYCAFTLYLYYIFYYKFTFPILFYKKINITLSEVKRRKPSQLMVQSQSSSDDHDLEEQKLDLDNINDEYIYTLSGEKKKKKKAKSKAVIGSIITRPRSVDEYYSYDSNQQTKLLDDKSQIFIPSNPNKYSYNAKSFRYKSFDEESVGSISINLSDDSSDEDNKPDIVMNEMESTTEYNEYMQQQQQQQQRQDQVSNLSNSLKLDHQQYINTGGWLNRNKRKLKRAFKTIFWSVMFLICEFLILFYFASVSIPNNNVLNVDFNHWMYLLLRYSVWIIIAGCNSFIIPRVTKKLVKKVFWICFKLNRQEKFRKITITSNIIRSLNLVWIPMFSLFIFHNDCGRYSNFYWKKCDGAHNSEFEFFIGSEMISIKDSICSYGFFDAEYSVDYGKCFRSMLEEWGTIIIFSSFGYIFCMVGFWLYSVYRYHKTLKKEYMSGARKIGSIINVEYAEIWNHVQIVVLFGCSLPFVIPIIAFVLLINKWVYSSLLALNFRLSDVNPYFPARLLIFTNMLQQGTIILFMWSNDLKGKYVVIIADLFIDICFIVWWFWYRNTVIMPKRHSIMSAQHQHP